MFKDEVEGKVIDEFVGLRAKLYSYKMFEGEEAKKCKGIKKSVIKKCIKHEDYKKCLSTGEVQLQEMSVIRSYKHVVYTEVVNKIALCSRDDKRYIQEGHTDTLALRHYKLFSLGKQKKYSPGRIIRGSLTATQSRIILSEEVKVNIVVNGHERVNQSIVKKSGDICSCTIFRDPIELKQCDVINFISRTTNSKITNAYISILIELDI